MSVYLSTFPAHLEGWNSSTLGVDNRVSTSENTWEKPTPPMEMAATALRKYAESVGKALSLGKPSLLVDDSTVLKVQERKQPLWLPIAVGKVRELAELSEGWDMRGSRRIQPNAIANTLRVLEVVAGAEMPMPHISPISGGALQIEWSYRNRDLEIVARSDGSIRYLQSENENVDEMQDGTLYLSDRETVFNLLHWLIER